MVLQLLHIIAMAALFFIKSLFLTFTKKNRMRKVYVLIAAFLLAIVSHSLGQKNDLEKLNLKGKIKFISELTYQPLQEGDMIIKGRMVQWYTNSFDQSGNKIEDIKYKSDSTIDKKYIYKYNSEGKRQELTMISGDDLLTLLIKYQYDSQGNLAEDISYDEKGQMDKKIMYLYGDNGLVMEENIYASSGELRQKLRYAYNSEKLLVETSRYRGNGKLERRITYKHDNLGNETEEKTFSADGSLISTNSNVYEFDHQGNWIRKTTLSSNLPVSITEREIIYY
jgi:hypothetical protein